MRYIFLLIILLCFMLTCQSSDKLEYKISAPEVKVKYLPLNGPAAKPSAEISGLAWFRDWLILLPQYPDRFQSQIFYIEKELILHAINQSPPQPITPKKITIKGISKIQKMDGYQGFEAVCFSGDNVFLTVELNFGDSCSAFIVKGKISAERKTILLGDQKTSNITSQSNLPNFSEEAILCSGDSLLTFHEANGRAVNPDPIANLFNRNFDPMPPLPMHNINYRITDATMVDHNHRFWVINYLWPGEIKRFGKVVDPIFLKYGIGKSHAQGKSVERLLELETKPDGIVILNKPPILLELDARNGSRNWEGIARLDDMGFLIITDKHPGTLFGFVLYNPGGH